MRVIRRFGLLVYWIAFAAFAIYQGQYNAPFGDLGHWRYALVFIVLALLAVAVRVLHIMIRPMSYSIASPRFGKAFGYSVVLLVVFSLVLLVTDMPPVFYVPSTFANVTVALTFLAAAAEAIAIEVRDRRN